MSIRTSDQAVRAVIDTDADIKIGPFIQTANRLTDHIASKDSQGLLSAGLLVEIETYLAAHFYARRDPQYRSKATDRASARFQGHSGMRLDSTDWGQDAITLDVSGCLAVLNRGKHQVGLSWLGLPPSEQTDYTDRD